MNRDSLLGQLSRQHQMMTELLMSVSAQECYHCYHPELAPLAWYLALSSYLETYWVREVGQGNDEVTCRSREIFFLRAKTPALAGIGSHPGIIFSTGPWNFRMAI